MTSNISKQRYKILQIYHFSFIMEENTNYVSYLQQLLKENNVLFLGKEQYQQREKGKENTCIKQSEEKGSITTLTTNVQEPLNRHLVERYSRQMLLKQISYEGQNKIIKSKVALVGSGGIGCPLALYLAAAGVGTIGLFDSDTVDLTNLHRQVGHRTVRVGMEKTQSLKRTLLDLNPHIKVNKHPFITVQNSNIFDEYDYIIDGSDNPKCRYIVNDYCMKKGKKLLSGACIGWQAQITCYGGENLCYRCLWGNDQVSMGGCSSLGVIGMLPGIVGMVLAVEALKLIVNGESSLSGKLLTYDGRKCEFKKVALRKKKPECIGCGQKKLDMVSYNYEKYALCNDGVPPKVLQLEWSEFLSSSHKYCPTIIDVRPSNLYNIVHFTNSVNIPLQNVRKMTKQQIAEQIQGEKDKTLAVSCVRGVSSRFAVQHFQEVGFKAVSIAGGIKAYSNLIDHSVPQI